MSQSILDQVPSHARPNVDRVKNKSAAPVQVTAEQLLREAWEQKESAPAKLPKLQIADREELQEYQRSERKTFEMRIVRNRAHLPLWQRYARWEEDQSEFTRARSVWERAVDNDFRNPAVWLGYAEMEMRHRFVNHARNVLDRAVALLPRADALWLKYAHMEEMLGKVELARLVFARWLKWFPENTAYFAFIRFELRHNNVDNARNVYAELLAVHPTAQSYIKAAKFEERHQHYGRARDIFERATDELPTSQQTAALFIAFAKFEQRRKQHARARAIYKFALAKLGQADSGADQQQQQQGDQQKASTGEVEEVERAFAAFEKLHGDRDGLESLLHSKKVQALETQLKEDPTDYESWFELMQLEESQEASVARMRDVFERAIANVPPVAVKPGWRRYIQLWLAYAAWAELSANDLPGAIAIHKRCVAVIPDKHRHFTFGKVWIAYAHAEIRRGDVGAARAVFGAALGVAPRKRKVYAAYVAMESALGEMERAREIFTVWVARDPTNGAAFAAFAELEARLGETARARGVLEAAVSLVPDLHEAETVWMRLADVVASEGDDALAAQRFETYVDRHESAIAWLAFVRMLRETGATGERVRATFRRATTRLRERARSAEDGDEDGGGGPEEGVRVREDALRVGEAWTQWETEVSKEEGSGPDGDTLVAAARDAVARRVRGADGEWAIRFADEVAPQRAAGSGRSSGTGGVSASLLAAARRWKSNAA